MSWLSRRYGTLVAAERVAQYRLVVARIPLQPCDFLAISRRCPYHHAAETGAESRIRREIEAETFFYLVSAVAFEFDSARFRGCYLSLRTSRESSPRSPTSRECRR